jgi:dihydroorotase
MNSSNIVIRNAQIINEGKIFSSDVWIKNNKIFKINPIIETGPENVFEIDATGLFLIPGLIDDQVHFREPGLTYKGDIFSESRAAVSGGITSFMEMPNTVPNALSQDLLSRKFEIASEKSLANYSFYMGVSNDNFEEVIKTDLNTRPGIKIFLGSSTGNMLVDRTTQLEKIFSCCPQLIAVHCEDETLICENLKLAIEKFGKDIPPYYHPVIRNEETCYKSSSYAVALAKKYQSRLHVLHISTEKELSLFDFNTELKNKRITAEACIHHLWFCDEDYEVLGNLIKWNPSIKTSNDRAAIQRAVINGQIDVIATDHSPHTLVEKEKPYLECPSGGPLVQHSLVTLLELFHKGIFSLEEIVKKTSHQVAECFRVDSRGYIREGYFADLCLFSLNDPWRVEPENILYKCGWSPFMGKTFQSKVYYTLVNGNLVYAGGLIHDHHLGRELRFI